MRLKRLFCIVLVGIMVCGCTGISADALEYNSTRYVNRFQSASDFRATGSLNFAIPANKTFVASSSFPLAAEESITIKVSFTPFNAVLDIGVIAPNGSFYYFNVTGGTVDKTIKVSQSGNYTLKIRNISDYDVELAGFVRY